MGIKLEKRKSLEETIVGQITKSVASLKTRNNMYIQLNKISNGNKKFLDQKSMSLYSARFESGSLS